MAERIEAVKAMANNIFQVFDIDKSGDLDVKELGRKTPLLKLFFIENHFAKTGSGQI